MACNMAIDARSKRVLIVDDELMESMLLDDLLAELGYAVAGTPPRRDSW
jgi:CheY-like chemotaxis protein